MVLLHHVTPCNDDVRELLKVFRTEVQEKMMLALFLDDALMILSCGSV